MWWTTSDAGLPRRSFLPQRAPGATRRIVVNHLTRMKPGYICVAGLDLVTGRHVRPVLPGRLTTALLARHGGPFDIASIVDLGPTQYCGQAPETEDHLFDPRRVTRIGTMGPEEFWKRLVAASATRLVDIFGHDLTQQGSSSAGVPPGKGIASLGCLFPKGGRISAGSAERAAHRKFVSGSAMGSSRST
jgi:hypothetical protein